MHMEIIEFQEDIFVCFLCYFGQPSHALVAYYLKSGGMPLHDAVVVNCKKDETTADHGAGAIVYEQKVSTHYHSRRKS